MQMLDKSLSFPTVSGDPKQKGREDVTTRSSVYESVTSRIVTELEGGVVPWIKPWIVGRPYNVVSQRPYSGVNILLLWQAMAVREHHAPAWLTYRQAQELGGTVRRGERSVRITFAKSYQKRITDEITGEVTEESRVAIRFYSVFNIAQTEGLPAHLYRVLEPQPFVDAQPAVEAFIGAVGAPIKHGGVRAYYSPKRDVIQLPPPGTFRSAQEYYSTAIHEVAHWTGHEDRLARDLSTRFGSDAYAMEELVAELTSAFVCADLGIEGKLQHTEYLGSWLKVLKADSRAIFTAARRATEAAEYLKSLTTGGGVPA